MARITNERFPLHSDPWMPTAQDAGRSSFRSFIDLNPPGDFDLYVGMHQETILNTSGGQAMANGEYLGRCLLDYVLVWLYEGTAGRDCTTYEAYLLSVIAIIGDFYTETDDPNDELKFLRAAHGMDFPVFFFGPKRPHRMTEEEENDWEAEATRSGAEGFDHPALQRDAYEVFKARFWQQEAERRMKQLVLDIAAAKQ